MPLQFSTKAKTLELLSKHLNSARVAPLVRFTVYEWNNYKKKCLDKVKCINHEQGPWIVRSSCKREDGAELSNAGAFLSLMDVTTQNLDQAVDDVIMSYIHADPEDEVLVQPMLRNVMYSGVAFSHDPNTCSPYRVVNWHESSDTSAVTGGLSGRTWQQAALSKVPPHPLVQEVLVLLDELLTLFSKMPVDCEFAVTEDNGSNILWLLQARPLVLSSNPETPETQAARLHIIEDKVKSGMQSHPFLMGSRTVYGVMPDWNPAEILGIRPKPLALSLYRELITDSIWAYQRHNYGYRNLRSFPLMPHFFGLPYIDVRLSFNSFIPADLNENLASRLVDYYINRLLKKPMLHDKIEFEIVFSCYTLDLDKRLERLTEAGFSNKELVEIAASLRTLTNKIIHPDEGLWRLDSEKLNILNNRRETLFKSGASSLEKVYWLIEDAKRYGTLPFAGLARVGFIAVQILRSLVSTGIFSEKDYDAFIGGVSTVSGQLSRDQVNLDRTTFFARYGHLRPGTYDILSPRYDEAPDLYFDWEREKKEAPHINPFTVTLAQMTEIGKLLRTHGIDSDPVKLLEFLQAGVELRELAKFYFTKNLSDALKLITEYGSQWGLSREDLAYCDIAAFKELHIAAADPHRLLNNSIHQGKERYAETSKLSLPPLISNPADVWAFEVPETQPNFITQKQVTASIATTEKPSKLANCIVCIPNADPGFDWLFSYPIAGLITAWGGANSHMAIRAGELGLPAVIGAGERLYRIWSESKRVNLDCAGRRVEVLA